jgi:hypothetical protein
MRTFTDVQNFQNRGTSTDQKKTPLWHGGLLSLPRFDATIAARKPKMQANGRAIITAPEPNFCTCHQPDQVSSICEVHRKS